MIKFWHQAKKQSELTREHEITLIFINFVVQYIQFVLQLFQIYYNFSAILLLSSGVSYTKELSYLQSELHGDGQTELCILSPACLSLSSVFSICSIYSIFAIHKYCPYSLSSLLAHKRKGKCFCGGKRNSFARAH